MKDKLTLGLFGFGCVGQGLFHVLEETHGLKADIKKICVKNRTKQRPLSSSLFTFDKYEILNDPDINIVVELIDDAEAAFQIVKEAVQKGKHVVTANKKMLAHNLPEIIYLQKQYKRSVLYEGAVCGSIPIIRNLEEYYDNDLISGIEGIFNGSTNYILTRVIEEKLSYHAALGLAQQHGFAESDPTLDVQGFDPAFKLAIAITHAFGVFVQPDEIIHIGIDKINDLDLAYARQHGYTIKLVARAIKTGDTITGLVAPQFVDNKNPLYGVRNEFNAISVEGAFSEKQLFIGKGAGSYPTGSAVLSDISALSYRYAYEYKKIKQQENLRFSNDASIDTYVRYNSESNVRSADFEELTAGYASSGQQYMIGKIGLNKIRQLAKCDGIGIILTPNASVSKRSQKTIAEQYSAA